ncbi:MAG: hypothetical protein JWL87_457 [Candidatus Adlerbacteria bacterium]|nr:hypothetical protein [Candidatus Adlerbacteria bacterium]
MFKDFIDRPSVAAALVVGGALVLTGIIFSSAFVAARGSDDTISVTGSAKTSIKADQAKWTIEVYRSAMQEGLQAAYGQVGNDATALKAYFKTQGIAEEAIVTNTITGDQDWSYQNNGGPIRYRVHQDITITSEDVEKVQGLAQNVTALITRGYSINPHQPEYYVTTLPELRVSLLGEAITDAKTRAQEIAKSGGSSVGKIKTSSSGVVQVMAPNSTNVEDYGSYDTSTIEKEVSVTARATFLVR